MRFAKRGVLLLAVLGAAFLLPAQINNGGGGASTNPTTNVIPYKSGASTFGDSPLTVSSGNVTDSGTFTAAGFVGTGVGNFVQCPEGTPSGAAANFDAISCDSATHAFYESDNNGTFYPLGRTFVNNQTGTSYTVVAGDANKLVTFSNASAIAVTLPQASATFPAGWKIFVQNRGAGSVTITPTTSTVDGSATLVLATNQGVMVVSDGTNYFTGERGTGGSSSTTQAIIAEFPTGQNGGFSPAISTTYFVGNGRENFQSTEVDDITTTVPFAGTVKSFCVQYITDNTGGTSFTATMTLRKNKADTTMVVTQTWAAPTVRSCDSAHTVAISAGDFVDVKVVTSTGTPATGVVLGYSVGVQ